MKKKSDKAQFKAYLHAVLKSVPKDATQIYYDSQVDAIVRMAENVFSKEKEEAHIPVEDIDSIYAEYPTRCVVTGRALGKSSSDKNKIERLLRDKTKEQMLLTIRRYVDECKADKVYMKNFGTFLNNFPDYDLTEKTKTVEIGGYRDLREITEAQ